MSDDTANRLRTDRIKRGFTQAQAARILGVSRATWIRWESGTRPVRAINWALWCAVVKDAPQPVVPVRAVPCRANITLILPPGKTLAARVARFEIRLLRRALVLTRGNKSAAGRLLGLSVDQTAYLLRKHSAPVSEPDPFS